MRGPVSNIDTSDADGISRGCSRRASHAASGRDIEVGITARDGSAGTYLRRSVTNSPSTVNVALTSVGSPLRKLK